ncbi:MAG: hypothetical protein ACK5PC_16805 [Cyclobacteriaceae bacterium]|jgi:hypothetical protein
MINIVTYRTAELNFEAIKNDSINLPVQFLDEDTNLPVDLSTYTSAKLQIKESELNSNLLFEFTSTGATNQLLINQLNIGIITLKCPSLNLNGQVYVYDLQLKNNTDVETIAKGQFTIIGDITV